MIRHIWIFIILLLISFSEAFCLEIPQNLLTETTQAIKNGKALYEAVLKGPIKDQDAALAKVKINDFCDFSYKAYAVAKDIYFIGEVPSSEGSIVFGRHYKVSETGVTNSSTTCFVMPPPPNNMVAAFTTHLLSDTPTEFHVFLSLINMNPIYVGTKVGIWKVQQGKIEFMEKK